MMQQINLLNPQLLTLRVTLSAKSIAMIMLAAAGIGLVLYGYAAYNAGYLRKHLEQAQTTLEQMRANLDALSQPTAQVQETEAQTTMAMAREKARIARLVALRKALGTDKNSPMFSARLRALAHEGVAGVWITGFVLSNQGFQLSGRALDARRIPDYLALLSHQTALRNLPLSGVTISQPEGQDADKFPGVAFVVQSASRGEEGAK